MERFLEIVELKFLTNEDFTELVSVPGVTKIYNGLSSLDCTQRWYTVRLEEFSYEVYVGNTFNFY